MPTLPENTFTHKGDLPWGEIRCGNKECWCHALKKSAPSGPTVPEILRHMAKTYEERNTLYGNNYKRIGQIFVELYPDGLTVRTADEWNRLFVMTQVLGKITRYAAQFAAGGHLDSAHDAAVYSAMLEELTRTKE